MAAITVNTFPSLNSFTSARSWFMAFIILLHVGFFWALSTGLSKQMFPQKTISDYVIVPPDIVDRPPPRPLDQTVEPDKQWEIWAPEPEQIVESSQDETVITVDQTSQPPPSSGSAADPVRQVVVVQPTLDPRRGLTEPVYPAQSIRLNETGTVLLSVQVLPNGRVGEVRIERSSGHERLDAAALREARMWRFVPGTHDGVAVTMWKQIPITFRLDGR